MSELSKNLKIIGEELDKKGHTMMRTVTIPIMLFVLGAATFPIGIIFWVIGLAFISSKK